MTRAFRLSGHRVRPMEPSRSRIEGRALIHKYIKAAIVQVSWVIHCVLDTIDPTTRRGRN
jgi:hypothetical protein